MIVAIDGPAGAGKSTIAERCAMQLGFLYINSGNFYRMVTYEALKNNPESSHSVIAAAYSLDGHFESSIKGAIMGLHSKAVDRWVSHHAAYPEVRTIVNRNLHRIISHNSAIVEGRDIATVLFPDAALKVYLDATAHARAIRRLRQHRGASAELTDAEIEIMQKRIEERDSSDRTRKIGALQRDHTAMYIDTTHLTIERICEMIVARVPAEAQATNGVILTDKKYG